MVNKVEALTPPETVAKLLGAAGADLVLVGGQALAFWANRYGVWQSRREVPAISNDVDFLARSAGDKASVRRLAHVIHGQTVFPSQHDRSALVGQAVLDVSSEEYVNVDVIFRTTGLEGDTVRQRAVKVTPPDGGAAFYVMHPLDVLHSRLANLYELAEKRNDKGEMQLELAIEVAREFLRSEALKAPSSETATGRSPVQRYVSAIEKMAIEDAGRKVAKRHGLHVADAIDPSLIPAGPFWTKRWPSLRTLMSQAYSASIQPPSSEERPTRRARDRTKRD